MAQSPARAVGEKVPLCCVFRHQSVLSDQSDGADGANALPLFGCRSELQQIEAGAQRDARVAAPVPQNGVGAGAQGAATDDVAHDAAGRAQDLGIEQGIGG